MPGTYPTGPKGAGFSLLELLIALAIMAVLAALLFPAVAYVQASAQAAKCSSNLRQIGTLAALWSTDNGGWLPQMDWDGTNSVWASTPLGSNLRNMGLTDAVLTCPSWRPPLSQTSYGMNQYLAGGYNYVSGQWGPNSVYYYQHGFYKMAAFSKPGSTPFFADSCPTAGSLVGQDSVSPYRSYTYQHHHEINVLYLDGHAEAQGTNSVTSFSFWTAGFPEALQ
jgi:prepilin-type N-terminal cleavage/methylation domain-containing protein/prepilin-type processing-associated H-X9-DG protein